jgi:ATP-binding cassette subfamily F protein 3
LLSEARTQRDNDNGDKQASANNDKKTDKKLDKKAQRQQSAEARKQLSTLKQQLQKIERELGVTQQKLTDVEQRLAAADLYEDAQRERLQTLLKDQGVLRRQAQTQEEQWLQLQEELEKLQAEPSDAK